VMHAVSRSFARETACVCSLCGVRGVARAVEVLSPGRETMRICGTCVVALGLAWERPGLALDVGDLATRDELRGAATTGAGRCRCDRRGVGPLSRSLSDEEGGAR